MPCAHGIYQLAIPISCELDTRGDPTSVVQIPLPSWLFVHIFASELIPGWLISHTTSPVVSTFRTWSQSLLSPASIVVAPHPDIYSIPNVQLINNFYIVMRLTCAVTIFLMIKELTKIVWMFWLIGKAEAAWTHARLN